MQDNQTVLSRRNSRVFTVLLCAVGLLINFLGVKFALALKLPVFLDVIGSALTAALGGYIPAIIVGFLTNLINGIGDYTTTYYGSLSVLIAVSAAYFASKGYFSKLSHLPLIILVFSLIGGGLGSVLTWSLYGFDFGTGISAPLSHRIFESGALNQFWSQFCADMLIDLLDKTITVLIVALVLRFLPESFKSRFRFIGWKQTPMNRKSCQEAESKLARKTSLKEIPPGGRAQGPGLAVLRDPRPYLQPRLAHGEADRRRARARLYRRRDAQPPLRVREEG